MNYMKKKIIEIFKNNLEYVYYARSGIVYHTLDIEEIYYLTRKGWKYNNIDSVSPPVINVCDICDCSKIMQYENAQFNLSYYMFLKKMKENNNLENFINNIINTKNIYYKEFYYHISDGPILENSIRIKGIDERIYTLKIDLVRAFIKCDEYEYYVKAVKNMMNGAKKYAIESKNVEYDNIIDEFYKWLEEINKSINYNIEISKNKFNINKEAFDKIDYDLILLIPNGCYKYIDIFASKNNINKMFFQEIHADDPRRGEHVINKVELKNKKVLIIDSAFSGRTLLTAKRLVEEKGGNPIILGIYPKSRNILNMMDYALIGNKVYNREELKDEEDLFIKLYINNLKECK